MSEEEWKELSRLLQKAHAMSGFMGLTADDLEQLNQARRSLSFSERARLLIPMSIAAGMVLYDAGNVLGAILELDDKSSEERERRPCVLIRSRDGSKVHVETIDIIESVERDAALIGHPAIVWAIKHWERVIHAKKVLLHDNVYYRDEEMKEIRAFFEGGYIKNSERNLKAVVKAFEKGIKHGGISSASALAIKMIELNLDDVHNFLFIAWERLSSKIIEPTETVDERIAIIELYLRQPDVQVIGNNNLRVTNLHVMDFLRDVGRKYVGRDNDGSGRVSYRPNWAIFRNAFARWYFNVPTNTFQDFLTDAKKQDMSEIESWNPPSNPKVSVNRLLTYILTQQLVSASTPFIADLENSDLNR